MKELEKKQQQSSPAGIVLTGFNAIVDSLILLAKLVVVILFVIFLLLHWSYFSDWAKTISHAEIFGIKLDREEVDKHISVFQNRSQPFDVDWLGSALKEAELLAPAMQDAQIVWVDSHPENNRDERQLLQQLGVHVQVVWSTKQLIDFIKIGEKVDLIISNIPREGNENPIVSLEKCPFNYSDFPNEDFAKKYKYELNKLNEDTKMHPPAGLAMAEILVNTFPDEFGVSQRPKLIYYSASNGGKIFGPCSIATTNRVDILMERIVDALATSRWKELSGFSLISTKTLCKATDATSCLSNPVPSSK